MWVRLPFLFLFFVWEIEEADVHYCRRVIMKQRKINRWLAVTNSWYGHRYQVSVSQIQLKMEGTE